MVSLFKTKSASAVVWITLLCIFVHLPFIFEGPQIVLSGNDTVLDKILSNFSGSSSIVLYLTYLVIVSLQANRLNATSNNLFLFPKENALPGMVYVLFTALLPQWCHISSALIVNTLFIEILATFRLLQTSSKPEKLVFNLSMLASVGVILYPPCLIWAVIVLFSMLSLCSFKFRLIFVWIIGLLLPFYFLAAYLFLADRFPQLLHFVPQVSLHNLVLKEQPLIYLIAFGFVVLTALIGILSGQQNSGKLLIAARKVWGLSTLAFFLTIGNAFLFPEEAIAILLLAIVPASLLGANTFYYTQSKWLSNVWFWLIVLGIYYTSMHILHIIRY
ncbi:MULTISPECIES: DUF6427 family protein [Chitinophagaceae]